MAADFDKLWNDDREDLSTLKEFCRYWYECGQKSKVAQNSTSNNNERLAIALCKESLRCLDKGIIISPTCALHAKLKEVFSATAAIS